jgi:hypothetical protein
MNLYIDEEKVKYKPRNINQAMDILLDKYDD